MGNEAYLLMVVSGSMLQACILLTYDLMALFQIVLTSCGNWLVAIGPLSWVPQAQHCMKIGKWRWCWHYSNTNDFKSNVRHELLLEILWLTHHKRSFSTGNFIPCNSLCFFFYLYFFPLLLTWFCLITSLLKYFLEFQIFSLCYPQQIQQSLAFLPKSSFSWPLYIQTG